MEIISFIIISICIIGAYHGHTIGVKSGADAMYTHLYNRGVRKDDEVIVKLQYEDRSELKSSDFYTKDCGIDHEFITDWCIKNENHPYFAHDEDENCNTKSI